MKYLSNVNLLPRSTKVLLIVVISLLIAVSWTTTGFQTAHLIKSRANVSVESKVAAPLKTPGKEEKKEEEKKVEEKEDTAPEPTETQKEEPKEEESVSPDQNPEENVPEPSPPPEEVEEEEDQPQSGPIQVLGSAECQQQVGAALNLMKSKAPTHYTLANQYLTYIECGEVGSSINPKVTQVRFTLGEETLNAGKLWVAGIIAHEYCHVKLYREGHVYNGAEGEGKCLVVQHDALEKMGADQVLLEYVRDLAETEWWDVPDSERWW